MKIKIALLDQDVNYLKRLVSVFNSKYSDKVIIHSFTDAEKAIESIGKEKIDIFIATEAFEIDTNNISERCEFAYFVENNGIESIRGQKAICKFQKVELIYKQLLNIYADKAGTIIGKQSADGDTQIKYFTSFSGGVGCSSLAAAFARKMAMLGEKVIYINLEKMGDAELFFKGDGHLTFSDVIYALKSKKTNLTMKIESSVKVSQEGVCYFAAPNVALDMLELKVEEVSQLIDEIVACGYSYIVLDVGFDFDKMGKMLWKKADEIIVVADGTTIANSKFERAYNALCVIQESDSELIMEKVKLIYNKFSNKTCEKVSGIDFEEVGGIPPYERASTDMIVKQIASLQLMDKLI